MVAGKTHCLRYVGRFIMLLESINFSSSPPPAGFFRGVGSYRIRFSSSVMIPQESTVAYIISLPLENSQLDYCCFSGRYWVRCCRSRRTCGRFHNDRYINVRVSWHVRVRMVPRISKHPTKRPQACTSTPPHLHTSRYSQCQVDAPPPCFICSEGSVAIDTAPPRLLPS